ncbi:Beta-glucanase, GH16 family [Pseudonocardia ammonioxydans]|uniref:Beta-glucanase, GH16 family n=1 Tax=Pseudonocardia ammonioxydans TaxID=260086 RepID=A0A1I4SZU8_PSUAM|nr:glycoside hydrolase family 16 protein [Pseudonocardia ammonioxydans]SFM70038.1 Beta-glucanase, GH16 family [Pseudonocardia ammonioxydans]
MPGDGGSGDDRGSAGQDQGSGDSQAAGGSGTGSGAGPGERTAGGPGGGPGPADCGTGGTPAGQAAEPTPPPAPADPAAGPAAYPGAESSAATAHGWGEPSKVDEFDGGDLAGWNMYDGPGHAGEGTRSPDAASVQDGILTINGDSEGKTAGMAWTDASQKYGRWEGRVRAPASDPSYNALLLLWPTAENFPVGGEIDFMEMTDHTRQSTELFLHYGEDNSQVQGEVQIDATQWHNWAVEWSPDGVVAYVDGKEWWRTDDTSILPPGPMHLCIQLDWFPEGGGEVKPSTMEVDWVRQYPMPESEQGGGSEEGLLDGPLKRITEGGPDAGSATRGPSGG